MMACPTIADGVGHSLLASLILIIVRWKRKSTKRSTGGQMSSETAMKRDTIEQDGHSDKVRKTLRGRAEKACVRCRAKKRTCDGGNPCQRCKESHSACYFSDWHYTVPYPREYVEYLEEQQEQLSAGLLVMYRLLKDSHIKTVPPLPDKLQAQDLLSALRSLRLDPQHHHPAYNHHRGESGLHNGIIMNTTENVFAEHSRRPTNHVHSPYDPGPTSPSQASVLSSSFHQSPRPDLHASHIPTTAPGSFPPATYATAFEFTRPSQPKVILNQARSLPSDHATSPSMSFPSAFVAQEPWQQQPDGSHPLSPMHSSLQQRSRRTSGESPTQQSFTPTEHAHSNDASLHNWGWSGPTGLGVGYYGSNNLAGGGGAHDSNGMMDWESIEQRGGIVTPHDSHAQHLHGKWHGAPLN